MEERLQKILSQAGVGSRRKCEKFILDGRVAVNGNTVTELGTKADPDKDKIYFDNKPVSVDEKRLYLIMNKPEGYTCTREDPHVEHTVMELLSDIDDYVYPVGRLDEDTTGLLIFTNDGDFAQLLMHPSHLVEKTYVARVKGKLNKDSMRALERGIELKDGLTAPARARLLSYDASRDLAKVELTIREGRNRQVRRMFSALGHHVVELTRVRVGELELGRLAEGRYRHLTKKEVGGLKKCATVGPGSTGGTTKRR